MLCSLNAVIKRAETKSSLPSHAADAQVSSRFSILISALLIQDLRNAALIPIPKLVPRLPERISRRCHRAWTLKTHACSSHEITGAIGRCQFHFERHRTRRFIRFGPVAQTQRLRDKHLDQGAGIFGCHVARREASQSRLYRRRCDLVSQQGRDLAAGRLVAGDKDRGNIPAARDSRQDTALSYQRS